VAAITATLGFGMAGCASNEGAANMTGAQLSHPDQDIIQIATGPNMGEVSILVQAIQAADLVSDLKGPGPFTVFAPTNEAFDQLPAGTLKNLLMPENKEKLKKILLYHVHNGAEIMASDLKTMQLSTMDGKDLSVSVDMGTVTLTGGEGSSAKIIKSDIQAKNGVIHWIDHVLMPPGN